MTNIIDQYGIINQQINELEIIKSKLKAELLARGVGSYNGESFFAEEREACAKLCETIGNTQANMNAAWRNGCRDVAIEIRARGQE